MDTHITAADATPTVAAGTYIRQLGYVGFEVSDFDAWEKFAVGVIGLQMLPGPNQETRLLKMDEQPYRFILTRGAADDIVFAGWKVADAASLDAYARYLTSIGETFTWADADLLAARGVDRMLRLCDPNGVWHEAYTGLPPGAPFVPHLTQENFVTGEGGLGHIVFGTALYDESIAFARRVLGGGISDTIKQEFTPTVSLEVTFLHVNERHHSIAYAARAGGRKLHHFMIEVRQVRDVGFARDRHLQSGLAVAQDIGQHPNDQMISYYGATPSGFFVEYGWGGLKLDLPNWQVGRFDRLSDWGHRPAAVPAHDAPKTEMKVAPAPVAGNWKLTISTPMGEQPADLVVNDALIGSLTAMGEKSDIYGASFGGGVLQFKVDATKPFPMTLIFSLDVGADTITGSVQAGPIGTSPVKGMRV